MAFNLVDYSPCKLHSCSCSVPRCVSALSLCSSSYSGSCPKSPLPNASPKRKMLCDCRTFKLSLFSKTNGPRTGVCQPCHRLVDLILSNHLLMQCS